MAAHADSRAPLIQEVAARLFRSQGYEATTVRDIARAAGVLPGSLYCHFATKEDLLVAVYARGVEQISASVRAAIARADEPWARLEAACAAHLQAILRDDDHARVVVRVRPSDAETPAGRGRLTALRNEYESLFEGLVRALPLPADTDRRLLRLMLLGALNGSQLWFREGEKGGGGSTLSPRQIATRFVRLLKYPLATAPSP